MRNPELTKQENVWEKACRAREGTLLDGRPREGDGTNVGSTLSSELSTASGLGCAAGLRASGPRAPAARVRN